MTALGLVVASFNRPVTEQMEERAREAAVDAGAEVVETVHVPGAYDTPLAADRLARRSAVDAVVVIGAIITGDTDHDQTIADAAASTLSEVSVSRDTPVTLGITGPGMSAAEARERVENAADAVDGALDLVEALPDPEPTPGSESTVEPKPKSESEPEPESEPKPGTTSESDHRTDPEDYER